MSKPFSVADWYWASADGRIYSSRQGDVVPDGDSDYVAWCEDGSIATVWPRDQAGDQTQAALDEALAFYGLGAIPSPTVTYKADIYRRCTDAEADAIEMALAAATTRRRRLFEESQYLDRSDEAFGLMHEAMVGMFGAERTSELLAPSAG